MEEQQTFPFLLRQKTITPFAMERALKAVHTIENRTETLVLFLKRSIFLPQCIKSVT